ncbi:hypothetical protein ACFVJH_39880 [Streptomyces decoyicus]|uniref:hypothetical protein n=1 Tax=Streptomyces decoyicus TaxID=249567 RepID=UPI00364308A0
MAGGFPPRQRAGPLLVQEHPFSVLAQVHMDTEQSRHRLAVQRPDDGVGEGALGIRAGRGEGGGDQEGGAPAGPFREWLRWRR